MKAREKLILNGMFLFAWIGLWLIGPENPDNGYSDWEIAVCITVIVLSFVLTVRAWTQLIRERGADRLKHILDRRDRRTNH